MDELDSVLDEETSQEPKKVPEGVKTLAIFSIVGNSLWIFLMLIVMLYVMLIGAALGTIFKDSFADLTVVVNLIILLGIGLHVTGLIAAINMRRGKKAAFILYAIVTGIWVGILVLTALNPGRSNDPSLVWFSAAVSLGFIVGFGLQMKNMPD